MRRDCQEFPNGMVDTVDFFDLLGQWDMIGTSCDIGLGNPGGSSSPPHSGDAGPQLR